MNKPVKYVLAAIALTFTAVAAVVVYVVTWDPNEHKDWIAERFRESTGRELVLGGDVGLSWYPWLGLSVQDLRVGNAEGFGDEPFLSADSATLRVKLMPILQGRYEIDTVRLHGAHVNLEVNEAGRGNWEDLAGGEEEPAPSEDGEPLQLANVNLGGVDIRDASLSLDDRFNGRRFEINGFTMSTGELVFGEPIQLDLTFAASSSSPQLGADVRLQATVAYDEGGTRYEISPLALDATLSGPDVPDGSAVLSLASTFALDLDADTLAVTDLRVDALDSRLEATLEGRGVQSEQAVYDTRFDLAGSDLAVFFRILDNQDLADRIAALDSRDYALAGALNFDMGRGDLRVDGLRGDLLGATVAGELRAAGLQSDAPRLAGELNASGPDLPALLEVAGQVQGGDSPLLIYGRQLAGISDRRFQVEARFDADLAEADIQVPVLNADLLGFRLDGNLETRGMDAPDGNVEGFLNLRGDNLGEVLAAFGQADLAEVARSLALEVRVGGSRRDLTVSPLDLDLVLAGARIPNSPVTLNLNAASRMNLDADTLDLETFRLSGLGLDVSGSVSARNVSQAAEFSGSLDVQPFDLRALLGQLNQEVPPTADPAALQRVALTAAFSGSADSLSLGELTLGLDDTTLSGSASVSEFANPAIAFDLDIDRLDADRYLAPAEESSPQEDAAPAEIPAAALRDLTMEGRLDIASLSLSGLDFSDFSLEVAAADGQLRLVPATSLYEGGFVGEIGLDVRGDVPAVRVDTTLSAVALGPLLQDLMDATYLSGKGNVELSLNASGADSDAMLASLDGGGRIALEDGVLQGVDVGSVLAQIEQMIRQRRLMDVQRGESTSFDTFSATLGFDSGVVSTDDLTLDAAAFAVTGRGTLVNLRDDSIAFNLVADVKENPEASEQYDIGGYSLPIACTGTIDSPRCLPDAAEIVRNALSQAVQRNVTDLLERALGGDRQAQPQGQDAAPEGESPQAPAEEADPGEEILNRAIENIFRRN